MSEPKPFDVFTLKLGNGATPTEVFTAVCGITNVTLSQTAETRERRLRDCAKPAKPGTRYVSVIGTGFTIAASGVSNADEMVALQAAFATKKNFRIEGLAEDGTDAGELLGTFSGNALIEATNISVAADGDSTMELTLTGSGNLTYTAAP